MDFYIYSSVHVKYNTRAPRSPEKMGSLKNVWSVVSFTAIWKHSSAWVEH